MNIKYLSLLAALAVGSLVTPAANAIVMGTYQLSNHPGGGIAPPLYGLRLDGLLGDTSKEYTFDFDNAQSDMKLTWDGTTIVISGKAFGGEDLGGSYGATAVWDIYFEYTGGISSAVNGGVDDLQVIADNANFGTISSGLGSYTLEDEAGSGGLSFQFGDEGGSGHRGFDGLSGWGWMNHGVDCANSECSHVYASDWLFTATIVPVPAAVWLFGSGLLGLVGIARRRV